MRERIYPQGYPAEDDLAIAIDSERVLNSIELGRIDGERAQVIFGKMVLFFDRALAGEEVARTLRFKITTPEDLKTYILCKDAYKAIAEHHKLPEGDTQTALETIRRLRSMCEQIEEGTTSSISHQELLLLKDFFQFTQNAATDRVHARQWKEAEERANRLHSAGGIVFWDPV